MRLQAGGIFFLTRKLCFYLPMQSDKFSAKLFTGNNKCPKQELTADYLVFPGPDGIIADSVDGPCRSGNFFLSALPRTNLYLLVIENWSDYRQSYFYNFNCHISNRVFDAGAFRIVNGTCAHIETQTSLKNKEKCPALKNVDIKCSYNTANAIRVPGLLQIVIAISIVVLRWS